MHSKIKDTCPSNRYDKFCRLDERSSDNNGTNSINRGYPGDLYSQLAARYEKAVDFEGSGSITILGVTTMPVMMLHTLCLITQVTLQRVNFILKTEE